jgi:hypothetical protein
MIYGIIYKYTSPSGHIYIGQTTNSPEMRRYQHNRNAKLGSNTLFHIAIRKYGIDNFKYEILQEAFSKEELNKLELHYIETYNSCYFNGSGYNMASKEYNEYMSKKNRKIYNVFEVFDKNNNLIDEFDHPIDCIKKLNLPKTTSIVLCLNNKLTHSHGYKFKYKLINS